MSHTPGPWHTGDGTVGRRIVYDARGMAIADAKVFHGNRTGGEDFANARLIAAAPELLDALTRMLKQFPADSDLYAAGWDSSAINEACDAYDAARAAVRKATGKE